MYLCTLKVFNVLVYFFLRKKIEPLAWSYYGSKCLKLSTQNPLKTVSTMFFLEVKAKNTNKKKKE